MEGTTFRNLGLLRLRERRLTEAGEAFGRALENNRRTLAQDHALIARVQRYQADVALALGDVDDAASIADEALDRLRRAGLPRHPPSRTRSRSLRTARPRRSTS